MKKTKLLNSEAKWGYGLVAPTIIGLLILNIWPFIQTLILSFTNAKKFGSYDFVGLTNYVRMFQSTEFWQATWNSIYFCILTVPVGIILALLLAVFLNSKIKGKVVFRAIYFLPMVVAPVAVAMVWKWMFNSNYGIINDVLGLHIDWLTNPHLAIVSCAVVSIWSSVGYDAVLLLSGLQNVPKMYHDAAEIDGANGWQRFRHVTIPCMTPMIFYNLLMALITNMQIVVPAIALTNGGPGNASCFLTYLMYRYAFISNQLGYACSISFVFFVIIALFTAILFATSKGWIFYEGDEN